MTQVIMVGGPADSGADKPKRKTGADLRPGTIMTREEALAGLSAEDKIVFENFLAGEQEALAAVKAANVRTPLFNAQLHTRADILDVQDTIYKTVEAAEDQSTSFTLPMTPASGAASNTSSSSTPGILVTGGPFTVLGGGSPGFSGPAPDATAATGADVQSAIEEWQNIYGEMRGDFRNNTFSAAVKSESKQALLVLMDLNLVNESFYREIHSRDPYKQYASRSSYDLVKESYIDSILKKLSIPLLEAITDHARGKDMLAVAAEKHIYATQDYLFNELQVELLDRFIEVGGDANIMAPDDEHQRHWLSNIAYNVTEADIPTLEMLRNKHGLILNVYDERGGTPFHMAASKGFMSFAQFLLSGDIDVLAVNSTTNKSALDLAEEGPVRRARQQDMTVRNNAFRLECYNDDVEERNAEIAAATAAGKEPPKPLGPFQAEEVPPDYPLELISLIQDAVGAADSSRFKKMTQADVYEKHPELLSLDKLEASTGGDLDFSTC